MLADVCGKSKNSYQNHESIPAYSSNHTVVLVLFFLKIGNDEISLGLDFSALKATFSRLLAAVHHPGKGLCHFK